MTKLMEWLLALSLVFAIWISFFLELVLPVWSRANKITIIATPFVLVGLFGLYCVFTIAYRVATFNDCPEAEAELKQEIKEAKADLLTMGLKVD